MKTNSRSIVILTIVFGYILLQFLWWEVLLVKQNNLIINEKQKLIELSSTDEQILKTDIEELHHKKKMQTLMIVGEGTVFLILLLFGISKIKQSVDKENVLNNQQKNFFLSITHELKTPIAATKLQLQTLQKQKLDDFTQQELIRNALVETDRLNALIDNVLLANSLDSGEYTFKQKKQNLSELVSTTAKRYYKKELEKEELKLVIEDDVFCEIDEQAFPSIITNLVGNALKYSGKEKNVQLELKKQNNRAILLVRDQGFGISDQEKLKVFAKFYRAGNEETRNSKGTGLGLFIVNYLVKKHNAAILIKDNTPKGSIFQIELNVV